MSNGNNNVDVPAKKYLNEYLNRDLGETRSQFKKEFDSWITPEMEKKGYVTVPLGDRFREDSYGQKGGELSWFFDQLKLGTYGGREEWAPHSRWDPIDHMIRTGKWDRHWDRYRDAVDIPLDEMRLMMETGIELKMKRYEDRILQDYHPRARKTTQSEIDRLGIGKGDPLEIRRMEDKVMDEFIQQDNKYKMGE